MNDDHATLFDSLTPSAVKSIKQRDLLNTWIRAYAACDALPRFDAYHPERMSDEAQDTLYYAIEGESGRERIIIDSKSDRLANLYGKRGVGQDLSEYLGERRAAAVIPAYRECIRCRLPVYTVSHVVDNNGILVAHERLLLPFSNGGRVDRLLASLKTISENGAFDNRNLMRGTDTLPVYKLRGVIDRDLAVLRPSRADDLETVEFV